MVVEVSSLLSLPEGLHVEWIKPQGTDLSVGVISRRPSSCCPLCAQASSQVHSRYQRTLRDVPCGDWKVVLHLSVRKFFCRTAHCPRTIFTERLPDLVRPAARLTNRLRSALQAVGVATGGEVGARLAPKLSMQATPSTVLRCLRAIVSPPARPVRIRGVDDWAYKRGDTYGTILVDLERHRVIDLLPDRNSETVKVWLQGHPEIEVISRDRASSYADAARQGAPQATQVADRFHLTKNVREKLTDLLDRKRTYLPFVEESTAQVAPAMLAAAQETVFPPKVEMLPPFHAPEMAAVVMTALSG